MKRTLPVFFAAVATLCHAQSDYEFKSGLAVPHAHRYGREAIVTDQVAYQMYSEQLRAPAEGGEVFKNEDGTAAVWRKVEVDTTGRFRGEAIAGGYIYLVYNSPRAQNALVNVSGGAMFYVNGEPRAGDIYNDGWVYTPVKLKKGSNDILIRCGTFSRFQGVKARLIFPDKAVSIITEDATLPHIVIGKSKDRLLGAVVVVNNTGNTLKGLTLTTNINSRITSYNAPDVSPNAMRKLPFHLDPTGVSLKGDYACQIQLKQNGKLLDEKSLTVSAVNADEHHSYTFISKIDGSVQYYSVAPYLGSAPNPALFLSVHGAGVQAIGQARAYVPKDWGVLVAPTNRRPRGFNWEDWGRIDALEVLELAKKEFTPDPTKIYLTGHSMGGHGTWYLGATYPDKWAAIAPCAGYPTLTAYGSADGRIPEGARSEAERTLLRASNGSNVIALASNYKTQGVYIFHGDADRTVPVQFARQMRDTLGRFHPDFSYYEYPGGSHWFGNESVDWPPLFEFFRWHRLKADSAVDKIEFITANPAVSPSFRWASVIQQEVPLAFSEINLTRDRAKKSLTGTTKNVSLLKLDLKDFAKDGQLDITIDSTTIRHTLASGDDLYLQRSASGWVVAQRPGSTSKNPRRNGTFKEAFNHRMVFVYGTGGSAKEKQWAYNKARYDAEVWYYRGNGAVDIVADNAFDPSAYPDRNVILYGNSATNGAWKKLLRGCPIEVRTGQVRLGSKTFDGTDLGAYFTWPRYDSEIASVGVVGGTGLPGMLATEANQYFAAGSGFPDYMIFSASMLRSGAEGIKSTGFFDNDWRLKDH